MRACVAVLLGLALLTAGCTDREERSAGAERTTPAAGACAEAKGPFADVTLNPDVPMPRCLIVSAAQQLRVTNPNDHEVDVTVAGTTRTLAPGAIETFPIHLERGVHTVHTSLYAGGGPELWLR